MRTIFIAVAKVFGLLQVYYGIAYATSILPLMRVFGSKEVTTTGFSGGHYAYTLVGVICTFILTFGTAWLLLCRTTWIADKLRIPDEPECGSISTDTIILTGTVLLGIYTVLQAAPTLVSRSFYPGDYGQWFISSICGAAFKLALGLFLTIRPRTVMNLLAKGEKIHGRKIIIGFFIVLTLLFIIGRGIARHPWFDHHRYKSYSTRTTPSNTMFIPRDTNTPPDNQWYAVAGVPEHTSTNEMPDFTNATVVDIVNYLQKTQDEMTQQSTERDQ